MPAFYLSDGPERVRVEPHWKPEVLGEGASRLVGFGGSDVPGDAFSNLRLEADERRRYDPGESPPAAVADALGEPTGDDADRPHRYTEWRIDPGDELYVLGRATRAPPGERVATVVEHRDEFVLSDGSQAGVALRLLARAGIGGVLAVVGFGVAALSVL